MPRPSVFLPLLVLAALWPLAAAGARPASQPFDVGSRERELAAVRAQIETLTGRLAEVRSRERGLEQELAQVTAELELQQARLDEAAGALALAAARVEEAAGRVFELEQTLGQIRDDLRRRLSGLYLLGRHGYLRLFFSMRPDQKLLPAIRQLRFLVLRDRRTLDRYEQVRSELDAERTRLDAQRAEVAVWQEQERSRHQALAQVRARRSEVLARVAAERQELTSRQSELESRAMNLARFINALLSGDQEPLRGRSMLEFRGLLEWPVAGPVATPYGPRKDPRYRTEVPHHGVDLDTAPGAKVHAVYPGEVMYAAVFEGYGPMVVVHHPGRVFTLYAGLELLNVRKGDVVSLGDVIGAAAESLYFEIRVESDPQDPARWMR
jgi:septal ring factor EnvC (AmiA/AmiB activator)